MSVSNPLAPRPSTSSIVEPRQERSRRTLERIVQAARELIEERGVEGVTVLEIVGRARSSVGSFYARFPGKEELVDYLNERVRVEAVERWEEAVEAHDWKALTFPATVEALIGTLLAFCREDAAACRSLVAGGERDGGRDSRGDAQTRGERNKPDRPDQPDKPDPCEKPDQPDEPDQREDRVMRDRVFADFRRLLLRWSAEITHPDPEVAVRLGFHLLIGGIHELLVRDGARPETPLDDERLLVELSRAYLGYLGYLGRAAPGGDLIMDDPFNIWA